METTSVASLLGSGIAFLHQQNGFLGDVGNTGSCIHDETRGRANVENQLITFTLRNFTNDFVCRLLRRSRSIANLFESRALTRLNRHRQRLQQLLLLGGQGCRGCLVHQGLTLGEQLLQFSIESGAKVRNVGLGRVGGNEDLRVDEGKAEQAVLRNGNRQRQGSDQGEGTSNEWFHDAATVPPEYRRMPWES